MKSILVAAGTMLLSILPAAAQQQAPGPSGPAAPAAVVTLSQSIDEALANGDDNRLLKANLDLARAQHAENVSRNSWGLGASAGAGYNLPGGDPNVQNAKASSLSSITSSVQGASVGVGLASLVVFAVTGGLAVGQKSIIKDNCTEHVCNHDGKVAADRGQAYAAASTATLVIGLVAVVAGLVMVVEAPDEQAPDAAPPSQVSARSLSPGGGVRWSSPAVVDDPGAVTLGVEWSF